MSKTVLAALVCLLAAVAFGQWSEPVVLGDSCVAWGTGVALVPGRADTLWAVWKKGTWSYPTLITARRYCGSSWGVLERLTPDSSWYNYLSGILDDSGRVLVAYYNGSYPVSGLGEQDSWGIYTVVRADTGWTRPLWVHDVTTGFPFDIRLGRDRQGGIGMTWEEGPGGMHHTGSVMFSRKSGEGWTPRKRMVAGTQVTSYGGASLISGDTTDFYLAYSGGRVEPPYACTARVWTVNDTLVSGPTSFAGGAAPLVRTGSRRHLVFRSGDTLFSSVNRGSGWEPPAFVTSGVGYSAPSLAADSQGFAWMAWTDSSGQVVLASYCAGHFWSSPETVALTQSGGSPQIAIDEYGCVHCCWLAAGTGGLATVRWAYRLTRPGVQETMNDERGTMNFGPTIVHGVLYLPPASSFRPRATSLLDTAGRKVLELRPGENDIRDLSPGVYFVHSTFGVRHSSLVTKVIVTR